MREDTIFQELQNISERLTRIETQLKNGGLRDDIDDHEKRIRTLEKAYWAGIGILSAIEVAIPIVIRLLWR